MGKVKVIGTKIDELTRSKVSIYKKKEINEDVKKIIDEIWKKKDGWNI